MRHSIPAYIGIDRLQLTYVSSHHSFRPVWPSEAIVLESLSGLERLNKWLVDSLGNLFLHTMIGDLCLLRFVKVSLCEIRSFTSCHFAADQKTGRMDIKRNDNAPTPNNTPIFTAPMLGSTKPKFEKPEMTSNKTSARSWPTNLGRPSGHRNSPF